MEYPPDPIVVPGRGYLGSRSTLPEHVREMIMDLAEQGLSVRDVAARVGVHPSTVHRVARAGGHTWDTEQTAQATRVRLDRLRAKRADLLEQAHDSASQSLALYQEQMIKDPRGRSEAARSARDTMAAYADLAKIDQNSEADAIMIASDWMDSTMGPEIERLADQYQRDLAEGRRDALDQLRAAGVPIPAELADRVAAPPSELDASAGGPLEVDQAPRVQNTQDRPGQNHPYVGDPLGRTRQDPEP
jgi:transposase-like protein